jgi:multidrug resistance protein MdtO
MSSQGQALPAFAQSRMDEAAAWFWQFLKTELAPYPGRAWIIGRITISATIVMVLVMTFRLPYGFLGAIFTMFLSRENPTATLRSGISQLAAYAVGTLYTVVGVMAMSGDPITHFLWIATSIFLAFYLIRILRDYSTAVGFAFLLAGVIPLWDETQLTLNARTENTLWIFFAVFVGFAVTVTVEYVFRGVHPIDLLLAGESRLKAIEDVLRQTAANLSLSGDLKKELSLYSALGTSRERRGLFRSDYPSNLINQLNLAAVLVGRLIDLTASLCIIRSTQPIALRASDRSRFLRLAGEISNLRRCLQQRQLPSAIDIARPPEPSDLPLLLELERTVALIPQAFSGTNRISEVFLPGPPDAEVWSRLLVADAFSNLAHLKFAVRGTLATMLAYVVYKALDWPGLSTSIATCLITALSTIGASRQKQFLRIAGTIVGGFGFGMGAQIFVLPYLDSIAGFTLLFAIVTAIAAWILTATPRLSYLGVQLALAFYLINLQEFAAQINLDIARDRVVGVLLGLFCMWLVFDRLWVRNALQEMQDAFCRSLRMLAELFEPLLKDDSKEAVNRVLNLHDQIHVSFNVAKAQADALLFEFGLSRDRKLKIRDDFRRWQPVLGVLLEVQTTSLQYRAVFPELPPKIAAAGMAFEKDMSIIVKGMSDDVSGKVTSAAPDIQESATALRQEIQNQYTQAGSPIPPPLADLITLSQNLASIVAPLYVDIHTAFTNPQHAVLHHPKTRLDEAA